MAKLFGQVLRTMRENAGLSIRDLARATGIAAGQLSQLEIGTKRDPTFATARSIAHALGVSLDDFDRACSDDAFVPTASLRSTNDVETLGKIEASATEAEKVATELRNLARDFQRKNFKPAERQRKSKKS